MNSSDTKRYQQQYVTSMKAFAEEATYLGVPYEQLLNALAKAVTNGNERIKAKTDV